MAEVVLHQVKKAYKKGAYVIHEINVTIPDGEFCVLLGPSGCGKSTVLRMIAGLEEITEGVISIDGRVVNNVSPKERDIAMVFQSYALYPHKTVYENIRYPLKVRKIPAAEQKTLIEEAVAMLNIGHLLGRYPRELSGGERQRVAVGRAIVRKPKVYLFDEPLSNLDAKLRNSMRTELRLLQKKLGITFIYVTHDQVEAMTMGDRIILIHKGLAQQVGTPLEVYNYPVNRFVGAFLGNPPMNFVNLTKVNKFRFGTFTPPEAYCKGQDSLILGIRPERLSFGEQEASGRLDAELVLGETIGKEYQYHVKPIGLEVVSPSFIVSSPDRIEAREGAKVNISFRLDSLRLFEDSEQGLCLWQGK